MKCLRLIITQNRLNLSKKNFPHADVEDARSMNAWEEIKHLFRKRSTEEEHGGGGGGGEGCCAARVCARK